MSFQKKTRSKILQIPGTKPSILNNTLLISSGVPSLDSLIGGGLPVGSVLLIEEDEFASYSQLLLKYFIAEGVICGHHVHISSADKTPEQILQELPDPIVNDPGTSKKPTGSDDMTIAWRYRNLPEVQSVPSGSTIGHYYDISRTMDSSFITAGKTSFCDISQCDASSKSPFMNPHYSKLLESIHTCIKDHSFGVTTTQTERNILRIGLHSLGSPQWNEEGWLNEPNDPSLFRFLYCLRSLLRNSFAACLLTIPTHLYEDSGFVGRIRNLCDSVIQLKAFEGSDKEKNPAFKEYRGLVNCVKLPHLNSLMPLVPDTMDLAFKLRRKKFTIEKLHLPPELSETASRSQEDPVLTRKSKLDF
ncbi:hypothetical protein CAPTEDRAFT_172856 [Capitella teleta]|uniref:Elongator complex protein 4 n=1 Tax=Capitella teleta TaxID=283909 RepID=R7UXB8_CAPTE|nr:hypothetical protein CAPTEDRAFT_172856 [Capitella teleta]|eukprot:ELU10947.1 hypothetical protein CAPTEDRAFT_172856 [Capitella teleta]